MGIIKFLIIIIFFCSNTLARPVSYAGGSTAMMFSNNMNNSIYYHFSPTHKYSLGLEAIKDKYFSDKYSYFRFTYLINRKNTSLSQRNLYFQFGMDPNNKKNSFHGVHGDWETRRLFFGFNIKKIENEVQSYYDNFLNIGFAPYLGDYGDIHTWLMLKSKKNSLTNEYSTYPFLRFFKGNTLLEFGYNEKTSWDIHLVYRI
jgi:hypothetical protein